MRGKHLLRIVIYMEASVPKTAVKPHVSDIQREGGA